MRTGASHRPTTSLVLGSCAVYRVERAREQNGPLDVPVAPVLPLLLGEDVRDPVADVPVGAPALALLPQHLQAPPDDRVVALREGLLVAPDAGDVPRVPGYGRRLRRYLPLWNGKCCFRREGNFWPSIYDLFVM